MASGDDALSVERLRRSDWIAAVEHYPTLGSTNDRAKELPSDAATPVLIVAEEQTAGRGRGDNRWWTARGSLALSLALDSESLRLPPQFLPRLSLAAAAGVVDAVRPWLIERRVGLHWPNDVFADGRKLAGILVEQPSPVRTVIGIGLNVNNSLSAAPPDVQAVATSLADLTGRTHDRTELLLALLAAVRQNLAHLADDPTGYGRRFQDLCLQIGRKLIVDSGRERIEGICEGVAPDGALRLATPTGRRQVYGGIVRKE